MQWSGFLCTEFVRRDLFSSEANQFDNYIEHCITPVGQLRHWWYLSGLQLNSGLYLLEIAGSSLSNLSYSMEELPYLRV